MQGLWHVSIKYVNIRVIYTLNKVVHSRTWSNIIVTDRYKCKKWAVCGMWGTNIITAWRLKKKSYELTVKYV